MFIFIIEAHLISISAGHTIVQTCVLFSWFWLPTPQKFPIYCIHVHVVCIHVVWVLSRYMLRLNILTCRLPKHVQISHSLRLHMSCKSDYSQHSVLLQGQSLLGYNLYPQTNWWELLINHQVSNQAQSYDPADRIGAKSKN